MSRHTTPFADMSKRNRGRHDGCAGPHAYADRGFALSRSRFAPVCGFFGGFATFIDAAALPSLRGGEGCELNRSAHLLGPPATSNCRTSGAQRATVNKFSCIPSSSERSILTRTNRNICGEVADESQESMSHRIDYGRERRHHDCGTRTCFDSRADNHCTHALGRSGLTRDLEQSLRHSSGTAETVRHKRVLDERRNCGRRAAAPGSCKGPRPRCAGRDRHGKRCRAGVQRALVWRSFPVEKYSHIHDYRSARRENSSAHGGGAATDGDKKRVPRCVAARNIGRETGTDITPKK